MMPTEIATRKPSLAETINAMKEISLLIEELEESNIDPNSEEYHSMVEKILPKYEEIKLQNKAAIDRRVAILDALPRVAEIAKQNAEYFSKKQKMAQNILERVKESTKLIMIENNESCFDGTFKKIKLQNNGGKVPFEYRIKLQEVKNVIDPADVSFFSEEYVEKLTVFLLKKEKIELDMINLDVKSEAIVKLERGQHIRVV